MQQLDFFNNTKEDQNFLEICKMRESFQRQLRALFAIITELQTEVINLREKNDTECLK